MKEISKEEAAKAKPYIINIWSHIRALTSTKVEAFQTPQSLKNTIDAELAHKARLLLGPGADLNKVFETGLFLISNGLDVTNEDQVKRVARFISLGKETKTTIRRPRK